METTRHSATRFGRPMLRERGGHEGGGQLFTVRRERYFARGLLSEAGHDSNYLVFQPSKLFVRVLGDGVLRLNEALSDFRGQAADHVLFLQGDDLQGLYDDLDRRIEAVRDRVSELTEFCNQGFDGLFAAALENVEPHEEQAPEGDAAQSGDATEPGAVVGARPGGPDGDVFESLRQANVEQGVLTEPGFRKGCVAFQPCAFYGRFVGEIACTLNDALRRMENRTSFYVADGKGEAVRQYYLELSKKVAALRGDLDGITAFCGRKVV